MVGTFCRRVAGLALVATATAWAVADDQPARPKTPEVLPPALDEPPPPFVPARPRTAADRERLDALRDFAAARALESQQKWDEAIALLESTLDRDPDSVAVLRRLSRLHRARGRVDKAAQYGLKVLEADPGDTEALSLLFEYHLRRQDPAGAEALLTRVLANPKLRPGSPAHLLASRQLGELYEAMGQSAKAADALARVVAGLDDKAVNRLSPADQLRILGSDAVRAYANFGAIFLKARRFDLAVQAFQRGLGYEPEHPVLPRLLAQALLDAGKPAEGLAALESLLKRQPPGPEPYELLARLLVALKRTDEVLPRLEAAAAADPKNLGLRYALADRYRRAGQKEKADAIYKDLIARQPDPRGLGALAAALLRDQKADELIAVLGDAVGKPGGFEAVKPHIESIVNDPAFADKVLAAGVKLQEAEPPKLSENARKVLFYLGGQTKNTDKVLALRRLVVKQDPSPQNYRELIDDLIKAERFDEVATTLAAMLEKHPAEKTPLNLTILAQSRLITGQFDPALEAAREAVKLGPTDARALGLVGAILARAGKNDEAIAHYQDMIARFPKNDEIVGRAHLSLSSLYVELEQFDKAEAELEALLGRTPDDPGVNNDLGYLWADRGKNLERAEGMIRKAVEAEPENASYLDSLGWVLFKRGKPAEALEPLEKAAKGAGLDATIHDHLGDVYFQLKEPAKARAAWQQAEKAALKTTPPDKRLDEVRKKLQALDKRANAPESATGDNP